MKKMKSFLPKVKLIVNLNSQDIEVCYIAVEEEEEDKVDSDFDLDSSEGEQEHIEEGQALDKELDKAEKRVNVESASALLINS